MIKIVREQADKILDDSSESTAEESNRIVCLLFDSCLIGRVLPVHSEPSIYFDCRGRFQLIPYYRSACYQTLEIYENYKHLI